MLYALECTASGPPGCHHAWSTSRGGVCSMCQGMDNTAASCALSFMQQLVTPPAPSTAPVLAPSGAGRRFVQPTSNWARSACQGAPICFSWNMGLCTYRGNCSYCRIGATCQRRHQAQDCSETPEGSQYKCACRAESAPSASVQKMR